MLKKTIEYTDYNGVTRKEDFYFNLSKAELIEMELGTDGGYAEMLQKIVDAQNGPAIIKTMKELILKAYGEKSADGKHFEKGEELSKRFSQTEAYSMLFMELSTNVEAATEFFNGIMPADLAKAMAAKTTAIPASI